MPDFVGALDQGTTSTRFMVFDARRQRGRAAPARARADPAAARLGRARSAGDRRTHQQGDRRRAAARATSTAARSRRDRRHQSARDDGRLESEDRPALVQRHRLAGHAHRSHRQRARSHARRRDDPRAHRAAARDLFLRRQAAVDPRERRRRPRRGGHAARRSSATIDTWVIWNLTGGVDGGAHVTDVTNASRTMLMDLRTLDVGRRAAADLRHSARNAARDPALVRSRRSTA